MTSRRSRRREAADRTIGQRCAQCGTAVKLGLVEVANQCAVRHPAAVYTCDCSTTFVSGSVDRIQRAE